MEQDQIKEIEDRYNHLKAITASHTEEKVVRDQAMEARIVLEEECFVAGYKFVPRGGDTGFYLKKVSDEQ